MNRFRETPMNRLITLRPLASAAVLAMAAMSAAPAFAALPHASASSLSRVSQRQPALSMPTLFQGTVVGLHRAQLASEISLANGNFLRVRFASVAQQQRL